MKKFLCLVLSLLITLSSLSALSVVTFAADEATEGDMAKLVLIGFEPAAEYKAYYSPYKYTGGEWVCVKDDATGNWGYEYEYDFYDILREGNKLVFKTSDGYNDEYVYTDGNFVCGDTELDMSKLSVEPSERNGKKYIKITYDDSVHQYEVNFADAEIEEIKFENAPYELDAYVDGSYKRLSKGDNSGNVVFGYNALKHQGAAFTVNYKNGESETYTYSTSAKAFVDKNNTKISDEIFAYTDSQVYSEWQPGGEYAIDCYFKGEHFTADYKVKSNPVKGVEYIQVEKPQYKENDGGSYTTCEIENCEACEGTYFNYKITEKFPVQGDKIVVTFADDTVNEYVLKGKSFVDKDNNPLPKTAVITHNDQNKKHWVVGENKFIFEVYGYEQEVTAEVTEYGITSVHFAPVQVVENNFGYRNEKGGAYIYDKPHLISGSNFSVSYTDGTTKNYTYDKATDCFVDTDGNSFEYSITAVTASQEAEPWGVGKHYLDLIVADFETQIEVNVVANSIEFIEFIPAEPYVFKVETDGEWVSRVDETTGEEFKYFVYDTSTYSPYAEGNKLVVYYLNGKVDTFTYNSEKGSFLNEKGYSTSPLYDITFEDIQVDNPWMMELPVNNFLRVNFMGLTTSTRVILDNGEKPATVNIHTIDQADDSITLYWSHISNAESYLVQKRVFDKNGKALGGWDKGVSTTENSFSDDSVDTENTYYIFYYVHAVNQHGRQAYNSANAIPVKYAPEVTGFKIAQSAKGISIKWDAFDGQIKIYRRASGESSWKYLAKLDGNKKAVIDPNANSGVYYVYKAVRVDGVVESNGVQSNLIKCVATPHLGAITNVENGIQLSWAKVGGATGYRVYRRAAGEKYFKLIKTTTDLSYCDTGVKNTMGVYYKYTVKAISNGYLSECEDGLLLQRNFAPKITSATNTSGGIVIKWNKLGNATEYKVYRRGTGTNAWTYLGTTKNLQYFDSRVAGASGNYYRYTVQAVFGKTAGSFDTNGVVILRLAAPEITRVRNDSNGVKIEFNAVKGATGYYVYHKTGKSSWVRVGTTTKTSFVDSNVTAGASYIYTVKAYKGSYMSDFVATTTALTHVPAPVVQSLSNEANGVRVTWDEVPMAEKYYVGRRDDGGEWKTIKAISKSEIKKNRYGQIYYIDTTAVDGKTYGYTVQANTKGTASGYIENRFITFMAPVDVLSAKNTNGGITVTWEKSPKANSYLVLRKAEGESSYKFYETGVTGTSFTDKDVTSGKTYSYKVWANGGYGGKQGTSVDGASKSCKAK